MRKLGENMLDELHTAEVPLYITEVDFSFQPTPTAAMVGSQHDDNHGEGVNKRKLRKTELKDEVRRLYDAASFLIWETGLFFNAHLTINAGCLGFTEWLDFSQKITDFNKEMNRCLFGGDVTVSRRAAAGAAMQRVSRRSLEVVPHAHYWLSVLEYGRDMGGHAHQLCVVPKAAVAPFRAKTVEWWTKHSPGPVQPQAIVIRIEHPPSLAQKASLQRQLFRYLTKTASANWGFPRDNGTFLSIRDIFKPFPNECDTVLVPVHQLAQISHRLSSKVQNELGFRSFYRLRCYGEVYDAWEAEPFNRQERCRNAEVIGSITV